MPKKSNTVIDKKTKEELTQQILDEINTTVKDDIVSEVVSDIKKSIDTEYKNNIKNEIREEITNDIKKSIQKEEKKLSRSKSFKIFRLYIYLIVVIGCALYMIYRLYATDNLGVINKNLTRGIGTKTTTTEVNKTTTEEVKDLNYYMDRYANLLDSIKISNTDLVKGNINIESISIQDKLALAYALLEDEILVDGTIYTIDEDSMKESYKTIFGSLDDYEATTFEVRGLNFAYSANTSSYLAVGTINDSISYVNNEIINIYEEDEIIVLEAKVYIIKDNYIYNATNTNYRLVKVTDDLDISKIKNRLSTVEYRFEKTNNQYKLLSIIKK